MLEELGLHSVDYLKNHHQRGDEPVTYIEKEFAIDSFGLISCIGQVVPQLIISQSCFVEISGVEFFVAGDVDHCKFPVAYKFLLSAESIAHELHSAFIIWREVEVALYGENDKQVFLRFYEVS